MILVQYVGGTANTVPFDDAPTAVVGALDLIKTRIQEAGLFDPNFNEVLTAAYMEEQKMAVRRTANLKPPFNSVLPLVPQ